MPANKIEAKPEAEEATGKVPKTRSPNYPAMNLEKAIGKTESLYKEFKRHPVPLNKAMTTMGYTAGSSTAQQAVAAIRYFGLAEVEGKGDKRQVRVSESGAKIVSNHTDRPALLMDSALSPPIHRELWDKFRGNDGLAPDATIEQYLVWDRPEAKFNQAFVGGFIEQFKQTMGFASGSSLDTISEPLSNEDDGVDGKNRLLNANNDKPKNPPPPGIREFSFPLIDGVAVLRIPHPMGQENYDLFKSVLEAAKAALVGTKKTDSTP